MSLVDVANQLVGAADTVDDAAARLSSINLSGYLFAAGGDDEVSGLGYRLQQLAASALTARAQEGSDQSARLRELAGQLRAVSDRYEQAERAVSGRHARVDGAHGAHSGIQPPAAP